LNRWAAFGLCGIAAASFTIWAFPRYHPSARAGFEFDREGFIERARQFVSDHGVDVATWKAYAMADRGRTAQEFRLMNPHDPLAQMLPWATAIVAFGGDGRQPASVTFESDGRVREWKLPAARLRKSGHDDPALARGALRDIAGKAVNFFQPTMPARPTAEGVEFAWQWSELRAPNGRIRIATLVKNGWVRRAGVSFIAPEAFRSRYDKFSPMRIAFIVVWWIALFGSIAPWGRGGAADLVRGMKSRSTLILTGCFAALALIAASLDLDDATSVISESSDSGSAILGVLLGTAILGMMFFVVISSLFANVRPHAARARGLRLLGTGDWLTRSVTSEALGGLLVSPLVLAIPLAIAAALHAAMIGGYSDNLILNRAPSVYGVASSVEQDSLAVLVLFGCMVPLALRLRGRAIPALAALLCAFLTFSMVGAPFFNSWLGNVLDWAFTGAAFFWIYSSFGVLGALAAYACSRVLTSAGVMLLQPAAGLHGSGVTLLAVLAGFGVMGLVLTLKGRESDRKLFGETDAQENVRTRREELLAEFNVARIAQQQMLPLQPPNLAGYTLAASCDPAREVGGDLYDFVRLKDGRWAIGVADVSGKGVPAALYMTLTKGLLCAAAEDSADPHSILAALNTHLREVTKKKMFVTMALGVLDPATGAVEYVRAGHNPIVWRRAAADETTLLKPAGIGLGISGPALFAKTLETQRIDLGPGDALVFYSDGLTEAMDKSLEQFGEERLMHVVSEADGLDASATRDRILRKVKEFLGDGHAQDDLTIAVLRVGENGR
jgi:serine phosphatase RsbU (regulator of sigma subunit)